MSNDARKKEESKQSGITDKKQKAIREGRVREYTIVQKYHVTGIDSEREGFGSGEPKQVNRNTSEKRKPIFGDTDAAI